MRVRPALRSVPPALDGEGRFGPHANGAGPWSARSEPSASRLGRRADSAASFWRSLCVVVMAPSVLGRGSDVSNDEREQS